MNLAATTQFEGYRRTDGRLGVRNRVLVLPSVICSHLVAEEIADRVECAVAAPHDHGCAQIGADNDQTRETFLGVGTNPNIAGTVVVGLGCEAVQSDEVAAALEDRGVPVEEFSIQGTGGTASAIEAGVTAVEDLSECTSAATREVVGIDDLTVGVVSGDLDDSTVERADPLVGEFVHQITDAGGRVLVAGSERFVAHETARTAIGSGADAAFEALLDRHRNQPPRAKRVGYQAAERGFDASSRFLGGREIQEIVPYGKQVALDEGVALVDAPSRFEEAATGLAAAGAQLVIHISGEGITTGHPIVPVLKVSGDPDTVSALPEDIDVDANTAAVDELSEKVCATANGERTCAERHGLTEFALTRVGPSM